MTTEAERQQVLQTSEILIRKEEYETALLMLQPLDCVVASWMKGKIYLTVANRIANNFEFKHYNTEAQRKQYREVLALAYEHLYKAGCLMRSASFEVRERLIRESPYLWQEIGKVENELVRTRPRKENSNNCEIGDDDFQQNVKSHIDSMVNQIEFWTLQ